MAIPPCHLWAAPLLVVVLITAACGDSATPSGGDLADGTQGETVAETDDPPVAMVPWPTDPRSTRVAEWGIEVVERIDHDSTAFTQGLEVADGVGFESTGGYGRSTIRRFNPMTGAVLASVDIDPSLFGEGLTISGDIVIQLTWQAGTALRWDPPTLEPLEPLEYDGEGWGICAHGDSLVMSDGTSEIRHIEPIGFEVTATVAVTLRDEPVELLNELECIDDLVVVNVWMTSRLLVFDPETGTVLAEIDASPLTDEMGSTLDADDQNVLNGVAALHDGTLLLSGKRWPTTFRVRLVEL